MKRIGLAMVTLFLTGCGAAADDRPAEAKTILAQGAVEAKAGWEGGMSAPLIADTLEAEVECAVQWEVWGLAIQEARLVEPVMAVLPAELQMQPSGERHRRWSDRVMARQDAAGGDPRATLEAYSRLKPPAEASFARAFNGEPGALEDYVERLSACRNP